ncbi:MAG: hypothetical protein KDD61_11550 [Bdellovibrionales bacterium]|nr:hypothetical protein [Bdellovibrionales bacterium]
MKKAFLIQLLSLCFLLSLGCDSSKKEGEIPIDDPSDKEALSLFKPRSGLPTNPHDLYGLWEATLGAEKGALYTGRVLLDKNRVVLAVKCAFSQGKNKPTLLLYSSSNSEAIITRQQIYVEKFNKQTVQKYQYFCSSDVGLLNAIYQIDHSLEVLKIHTNSGALTLKKILDLVPQ